MQIVAPTTEFYYKMSEILELNKENQPPQGDDYDEEFVGPMPISKLEGNGITPGDLKKLAESGFNTVESIAYT